MVVTKGRTESRKGGHTPQRYGNPGRGEWHETHGGPGRGEWQEGVAVSVDVRSTELRPDGDQRQIPPTSTP